MGRIGTLRETSLHVALKDWYARPGDRLEALLEGYQIDIIRRDQLIEIQTGNFSALKAKLSALLPDHRIRVVHPIAVEKWVQRISADDEPISRRKSPKRGRVEDVFAQLVHLPGLATHPNFSLEIILIQEEVLWRDDGQGSWRRKRWSVADRRLLQVVGNHVLDSLDAYRALLPFAADRPFTNKDVAERLHLRQRLAGQMTYTLHKMEIIERAGKQGHSHLYVKRALQ